MPDTEFNILKTEKRIQKIHQLIEKIDFSLEEGKKFSKSWIYFLRASGPIIIF